MSVPVIAFFNNRAGVGKTSLVYHVAHMFSDLGMTVLAADLDPQANLTALSLDEAAQQILWAEDSREHTLYKYAKPAIQGTGDVENPAPLGIGEGFWLVPGDLLLSGFEDELTAAWRDALNGNERPFRVLSAFWRVLAQGAVECRASAILLDLGPNLGSINRAALIGADFVVVPLTPESALAARSTRSWPRSHSLAKRMARSARGASGSRIAAGAVGASRVYRAAAQRSP